MATFLADDRRNPAAEAGQFAREFMQGRRDANEERRAQAGEARASRTARLQEVTAALSVLDQLGPDSRKAGVRNMLANLASAGDFPLIQETLQNNPELRGPSVDELRNQLGQQAFEGMDESERQTLGEGILQTRQQGLDPDTVARIQLERQKAIGKVLTDDIQGTFKKQAQEELAGEGIKNPTAAQLSGRAREIVARDLFPEDSMFFGSRAGGEAEAGSTTRELESPRVETSGKNAVTGSEAGGVSEEDSFRSIAGKDQRSFAEERLNYYLGIGFSETEAVRAAKADVEGVGTGKTTFLRASPKRR